MLEIWLGKLFGFILALGILAVALLLFYYALAQMRDVGRLWRMAWRSRHWANTVGRVVSAEVVQQQTAKTVIYTPVIVYDYTVNGVTYRSARRVFEFNESYRAQQAQAIGASHDAGAAVIVYYDPAQPQESVLELRWYGLGVSLCIIGLLLLTALFFSASGLTGIMHTFKPPVPYPDSSAAPVIKRPTG